MRLPLELWGSREQEGGGGRRGGTGVGCEDGHGKGTREDELTSVDEDVVAAQLEEAGDVLEDEGERVRLPVVGVVGELDGSLDVYFWELPGQHLDDTTNPMGQESNLVCIDVLDTAFWGCGGGGG